MKKITWFILMLLLVASSFSQNDELERLKSEAKANPGDTNLRIKLIEAYINSSNAEAALIEVMGIERANTDNARVLQVKGEALIQLEKLLPGIQTLQDSYLLGPENRTLKSIALADYAMGNTERGKDILRRLDNRDPGMTDFYFELYKRSYLTGRKLISKACMSIMYDFAGSKLDVYFPSPGIEIFAPKERLATEKDVAAVLFNVKHVHPVQLVTIDGKAIFDASKESKSAESYGFSKAFKEKIDLHDGNNKIKIEVTDIYGKSAQTTVNIDLLAFKRPQKYHGPFSDSLMSMTKKIVTNIPADIYAANKEYRFLVAGAVVDEDSSAFFESALFLFDWLSDPTRGLTKDDQKKIALKEMFTAENINPLIENWLYKESNIDTRTIVYLGGAWDNSADSWLLRTYDGQTIDIKAMVVKLSRIPADRIILIFDGWQSADMLAWDSISEIVKNSPIPIEVVLTKPLKTHPFFTQCRVFTQTDTDSSSEIVDLRQLNNYIPVQMTFGDTSNLNWPVASEPTAKINRAFKNAKEEFSNKLDTNKVSGKTRAAIDDFYDSWIYYEEISKYLHDEISVDELLNKASGNEVQMKGGNE